jgi:dipeptidyl-peptidase-4
VSGPGAGGAGSAGAPDPAFLRQFAETRAFLLGRPTRVRVTPDGRSVLYLQSGPRDPELRLFEHDVATGVARELVTPAELVGGAGERVSDAERARRERQRITDRGFVWYDLAPDGAWVLLNVSGRLVRFDRAARQARVLVDVGGDPLLDPRISPDGRRVAFVRGYDLWVVEADGGAPPRPVTRGGDEDVFHGLAEFVAQEEMYRSEGHWWSPGGDRLLYAVVDQRAVERFVIADPARPEREPARFRYPRAGRSNADVRLVIAPVAEPERAVAVDWDRERYPYVARALWGVEGAPLRIVVQTRDQRELALLGVDETSGRTETLAVERDEAWVNLDRDLPRWLPGGRGLLWASEASGRRALELRRPDGALERVLIPGERGFLSLVEPTADGAAVHALVGDPVSNALVRVDVATGALTPLTRDRGDRAVACAPDGSVLVDMRTAADALPEARLCGPDGTPLGRLADAAEAPPFRVSLELTTVTGASGRTYQAALIRPRAFAAGRRYPVVLHIYGGPHALMVKADERNYLFDQWLADHGAIVVCLDNRGTPRRDRAWERALKGRFGDVPLEDQIDGLRALAERHAEMDLARAGVYGWSFGGTLAALAVLRRPDVFRVGVAGAPVVDWHDYDTHYTERYLGLPASAPDAYRAASLLTYAAGLSRPLLVIHGTADDNVYFFHALKLAGAFLRAGRPFDFLPLPGVTHQIADAAVRAEVYGRLARYLVEHLA